MSWPGVGVGPICPYLKRGRPLWPRWFSGNPSLEGKGAWSCRRAQHPNWLLLCVLSTGGEAFSFKYSPGKLRGNQYRKMMTKEELEEEQR